MTDPKSPIAKALLAFYHDQNLQGKPITVAYSGGVDSQVLLHAVIQLKQQGLINNDIDAVHVNHGLSQHAAIWQQFCLQQAKTLRCPCHIFKVNLDQSSSNSLEELARNARYNVINQHVKDNGVVFTAHHQDDQVETLLLALKRGSGVQGLGAMHEIRTLSDDKNALLARPLLNVSRADIEDYANQFKLDWIEDESNKEQRFDRNFIRAQVLPLLKTRWPAINKTVSRSAQHCQQTQKILEQVGQQDLQSCLLKPRALNLVAYHQLTVERRHNLLRHFVELYGDKMPSTKQLQQIEQICALDNHDTLAQIKLSVQTLRRYKSALYLTPNYTDISQCQFTLALSELNKAVTITLPDGLGQLTLCVTNDVFAARHDQGQPSNNQWLINCPINCDTVHINFKHDNPKCLPSYRSLRRPLKKVLQELDVPTWNRQRLPIVKMNTELAAVLPLFVCKGYLVGENQKCLKINWQRSKKEES